MVEADRLVIGVNFGHDDTLFIATVLVTISLTTARVCATSLANAFSAGSSLSLWYYESGQKTGTGGCTERKHTFLTVAQSVISGSPSSGESEPETTEVMSCWTLRRSGDEMRTTMREVVVSDTPYRRIASLICNNNSNIRGECKDGSFKRGRTLFVGLRAQRISECTVFVRNEA